MKTLLVLAVLLLSGCTALVGRALEQRMQPMIGQDIHAVIQRLGYPAGERVIAGDTIYSWSTDRHQAMTLPSTSTTTGNVNGEPFYATTTGTQTTDWHYECLIEVATGTDGRVKSFQWQGNAIGCAPYAERLK